MTLAAQTFVETPELRTRARDLAALDELVTNARQVTLDGAGRPLFVIEGDLLYDEDELQLYALQREAERQARRAGVAGGVDLDPSTSLVGVAPGGRIVRWQPGLVLRYCVLRSTFPDAEQYEVVATNMAAATQAWQNVCGIEFEHLAAHDDAADPTVEPGAIDPDLVFTVRFIDAGGQFIAAAFFPTYPPARRRVFIDPSYFDPDLRFDLVGVLRHELGHVLGFRHEHIRSGAPPVCPDEPTFDTSDLTAYDPQSVMHYFCGGVGSPDLAITELDRAGAQKVYGLPFSQLLLVR